MFCPNCGKEFDNKPISSTKLTEKKDIFSLGNIDFIWWSIFALALPIVGFILALVWKKSNPPKSKSLLVASIASILVSFALGIVLYIAIMDFGWMVGVNLREFIEPIIIKLGLN